MSAMSPRSARRWGLVILIAGAAVLFSAFQTGAGHALLRTAGLDQEADGYTSLSFLHTRSLPGKLGSRHAMVGAPFVIHNVTSGAHDYHWSVALLRHGRSYRVHAGTVRLSAGQAAVISRSVGITCTQDRVQIVVSLEHPAESIDAWLTCWSRGS